MWGGSCIRLVTCPAVPCATCRQQRAAQLGTGWPCQWHGEERSRLGRARGGGGGLISSFKANISLQGLCKPLVRTG